MKDEFGYWVRWGHRRVSRRRLVQGAVVGGTGLAAVAAIGCGGGGEESKGSPAAGAQEGTPQKGGTIKLVFQGESPTYDPHVNPVSPNIVISSGFIFEPLMNLDPDSGDLQPNVATKWEYPDPTTLVLTLRDGVKFHDKPPANGRAMTADDVVYSLNRARTPDPQILYNTRLAAIDSVAAPDPKTVRIKLKNPSAALLTFVQGQVIVNKESIEALGGTIKDPRQAIGTGPFMATEFQAGVGGKGVRNPNYWDAGKPYLDGMSWSQITDVSAMIAAYRAGDIDFGTSVAGSIDETGRKQLAQSNPDMQFLKIALTWPITFVMNFNNPPFNDTRVRKAIDLVTDRQQLVQVVRGGAGAPTGPIWDGFLPGWGIPDKELLARPGYRQPKDQDLAEAKKLLEAAGHGNGLDLPADGTEYFSWLNLDSVPASVQQFAKVGIKLHVEKLIDRATFLDTQLKGTNLFRVNGSAGSAEPGDQLRTRYYSKAPRNYERYNNPQVDKWIDDQDSILKVEERKDIILKAQRQIMDDVALVHTQWPWDYAVAQPWLKGVKVSAIFTWGVPRNWWKTKV